MGKNLKAHLRWWNELLSQFNSVRLLDNHNHVSISLWTDACNGGLGAFCRTSSQKTFVDIPEQQAIAIRAKKRLRRKHINIKDTVAVLHAFERWGPLWTMTCLNLRALKRWRPLWTTTRLNLRAFERWGPFWLRQMKPDTIQDYLSALRSHHVDLRLNTDVFDSEHLKLQICEAFDYLGGQIRSRSQLLSVSAGYMSVTLSASSLAIRRT